MSHRVEKWVSRVALASIFLFAGVIISQLQVAFGWTNPLQNPPNGSGALSVVNGRVGINTVNPTTAQLVITGQGVPALDTDPSGAAGGSIIGLTATPTAADEAASKAYVDAQVVGATGGSGGGSLVLFYKELNDGVNPVTTAPNCPSGWTSQYTGYGPHYIGVLNYGWLTSTGGQGGFGGTGAPASPPPASGSTYTLNSVAIASDSVCSTSQTSSVPFSSFYQNSFQTGFSGHYADACYTDTTVTPNTTTCNRCVVCQK